MSIAFDRDRWAKIRQDYGLWWEGKLKRPLIHVSMDGYPADRPEPALPARWFTSHYDLSVTPEAIVDRWDYNFSRKRWLGDGFPHIWPNFGPGVMPGLMGATLVNDEATTWFYPPEPKAIGDLHFRYQTNNLYLERIKALSRLSVERWQGLVQIGMTDLGGNLDVLSTYRPSEALLLDLYDHPEEVKRLAWETHDLWWRYYNEINSVLRPVNPGYTAWTPIFSAQPYYMLQCDFCYMISPAMCDEFVKPELAATCRKLTNSFYHLDGVGELPHLDSLLSIPELKGVQWIPGAGKPGMAHWPEVYRRIRKAGKLVQIGGRPEVLDAVAEQVGSAEGIITFTTFEPSQEKEARAFLKRYGAE
jgi:hypothetical protein